MHRDDLAAAGYHNYLLRHVPIIEPRSRATSRGVENRLYPGTVALVFGIAGVVVLARRVRTRGWATPTRTLLLIGLAGVACFVLAIGDWMHIGGQRVALPFALLPTFRARLCRDPCGVEARTRQPTRAPLAAAVGVSAFLSRARPRARLALAIVLATFVCLESAMPLSFAHVPTSADDGGVDSALVGRPAGVVLELPIASAASGVVWPYAEAPRQYAALRDGDERVNGYSGFQPKNFDGTAALLNDFPSPSALADAHRLGVRYVVLRTQLVGPLTPSVLTGEIAAGGAGRYTAVSARKIVAGMPPGARAESPRCRAAISSSSPISGITADFAAFMANARYARLVEVGTLATLPSWVDLHAVQVATGGTAVVAVIVAVVVLCSVRSVATRVLVVALMTASVIGLMHYRDTLTNCDKNGCPCKFLGENLKGGGCAQE